MRQEITVPPVGRFPTNRMSPMVIQTIYFLCFFGLRCRFLGDLRLPPFSFSSVSPITVTSSFEVFFALDFYKTL